MTSERDELIERLKEIRGRLEAATAGPWVVVREDSDCGPDIFGISPIGDTSVEATIATLDTGEHDNQANAAFIAHAPKDIEFLLTALSRAGVEIRKDALEEAAKAQWHLHIQRVIAAIPVNNGAMIMPCPMPLSKFISLDLLELISNEAGEVVSHLLRSLVHTAPAPVTRVAS